MLQIEDVVLGTVHYICMIGVAVYIVLSLLAYSSYVLDDVRCGKPLLCGARANRVLTCVAGVAGSDRVCAAAGAPANAHQCEVRAPVQPRCFQLHLQL